MEFSKNDTIQKYGVSEPFDKHNEQHRGLNPSNCYLGEQDKCSVRVETVPRCQKYHRSSHQ